MLSRSLLLDAVIIAAMVAIATLGYRYSPLLLPQADLTIHPAADCDLQRNTCVAQLPTGGWIELEITPKPIPIIKPLTVEARFNGVHARQVQIDFAGVAMNMGYNRQALQAQAPDRFVGSATLPVCVTGKMLWEATLLVDTDRQRISVPFRFEAPLGQH